jgi:hypothetical protein
MGPILSPARSTQLISLTTLVPTTLEIRAPVTLTMMTNSTKYQYLERGALPLRVAYFEKHVLIASPKPIGSPSGGPHCAAGFRAR